MAASSHHSNPCVRKPAAPPTNVIDLDGLRDRELVDTRPLARRGAQHAADSLRMPARACGSTDDDRDFGSGHIESLVEYLRRDQNVRFAGKEPVERAGSLLTADLVGDRIDEQLARDRIRGAVIAGEYEHALRG